MAVNSVGLEELASLDELALALSLAALEVAAGDEPGAGVLSAVGPPQLTKSPRERTPTNKDFLFICVFSAKQRNVMMRCPFLWSHYSQEDNRLQGLFFFFP